MNLLEGKKGIVFGVANNRSIAWGISQVAHQYGAKLAFTYLNDALEKRVRPLAESLDSELILPCDVQHDEQLDRVFSTVEDNWGKIDFVIHSVAYAPADELKGRFSDTSRKGFSLALDVSAYSLVALANRAKRILQPGGAILTLTYLGAVQVVPHYRVMGVAKAALEACVRELAVDLGPDEIRVNGISAGPIKTLAASGISDFRQLVGAFESRSPLGKLIAIEDVGKAAAYLLSDLSSSVTGEIHYVDGGFSITAA